jgi:dolichol-phosphate mannosyltransferase
MKEIWSERVCVVIPMYRVESYIQKVIANIPSWVWKIVVVDDASPDRSSEMALASGDERVILVKHNQNQGVGGAMLSGYAKALELGATILVKMDGDDQMPSEYLPDLIQVILSGQADYAKGNRFIDTHQILKMPLARRIGNLGLSFYTKLASGYWNIFDPTNGFTAVDAFVFQRLDLNRIHQRYFFETSMLIELSLHRAVINDVMIPARYSGEISSLSVRRVLVEFPLLLFQGFIRRFWLQYFVLDFSIGSIFFVMGTLLTIFGSVFGGIFWARSILTGIAATTGTVMLAVLPVTLGFQLLLQGIVYDTQNHPFTPVSPAADQRARKWSTIPAIGIDRVIELLLKPTEEVND